MNVFIILLLLSLLAACGVYYWLRIRPLVQQQTAQQDRCKNTSSVSSYNGACLERLTRDWQDTFDAINDPILIVNKSHVVLKVNKAATEALGEAGKSLVGMSFSTILGLQELPSQFSSFNQSSADIAPLKIEMKSDPLNKFYSISCTPIEENGEVLGYIYVCHDFTHQRKLEQQLVQAHKMDAIATLAGGIAHDFNNILGAILGNADLLLYRLQPVEKGKWLPGNQQEITQNEIVEHIDSIRRAGHRAKELVAQILVFGRNSTAQREKLDIAPFIKESCKLLRASLPATIEMHIAIQESVGFVFGDPSQIQQVLMNLGNNAAQSLKRYAGIIEITLEQRDVEAGEPHQHPDLKPGSYVVLKVKDNGKGMPEEELQRIFDPFFTTRDVGDGSGMGLAVLHGIVAAHDGVVEVQSEVGQGTVFTVFLPCVVAEESVSEGIIANLPGGTETIMFVDDEEELVNMRTRMLEYLGYTVYPVTHPDEALSLVEQEKVNIDLLITDLTMPGMTGLELAREVHNVLPNVPVILCSGYREPVSAEEAKQAGVDKFFSKPHDMHLMAAALREIFH